MSDAPKMIHYYCKACSISIIRVCNKNGDDVWIRAQTFQNGANETPVRVEFVDPRDCDWACDQHVADREVVILGGRRD